LVAADLTDVKEHVVFAVAVVVVVEMKLVAVLLKLTEQQMVAGLKLVQLSMGTYLALHLRDHSRKEMVDLAVVRGACLSEKYQIKIKTMAQFAF
jgi:uncharacterized phage-associated protein